MRLLHNFFDKQRHRFEGERAPLRGLYPVFEAMEAFFFFGADRTKNAPHVRDAIELKRYMSAAIVALAPGVFVWAGGFWAAVVDDDGGELRRRRGGGGVVCGAA